MEVILSAHTDRLEYSESGDQEGSVTVRPVIYGLNNVISTGHWLTSFAGARMLMQGGNAFDAAVAATFAAAVVEPTSSFSFGSECVCMLWDAKKREVRSLCGQGAAPKEATSGFFLKKGERSIPTGPGPKAPLSFTTPGMFGAALRMLRDYGTKSIQEVLQPAIEYASQGIAFYEYMVARLDDFGRDQLQSFTPAVAEIFYPGGERGKTGDLLKQPALARTLQSLANAANGLERLEGIGAARVQFYSGAIADEINAASKRLGGPLRKDDLEAFQEDYEQPVMGEFEGCTIQCQSFWSQAPVLIQALNILENFDLRKLQFNSPGYIHIVSEALKLALVDRDAYYGDPKLVEVPQSALLSKEYAKDRARLIDLSRAMAGLPAPGIIDGFRAGTIASCEASPKPASGPETGTTHISVIDAVGNVVACTPSGGAFSKSVFLEELGFTLSTRSEMFNLDESHPNCVAPGKRPRTTLVSYILTSPTGDIMAFGCPGGDAQVQANLQLILNMLVWEMNAQTAVEARRFATNSVPNSFYPHTCSRGNLTLESGFPQETIATLKDMGHAVSHVSTCGMGATVTLMSKETGVRVTSSDPRRSCHAIGW
ncbi:gamma-glutamyltransferase family protein [Mesorhizobium salmacidum]|uniref:Gamma-glutamyltransferase n=1 Tax=Mesorhizobium salmacidum TaxID=3015171 RepID=A0ABU8L226_9HYPH